MQPPATLADLLHTPLRERGYPVEQITVCVSAWALPTALERLDDDTREELARALQGSDSHTARFLLDLDRALVLYTRIAAALTRRVLETAGDRCPPVPVALRELAVLADGFKRLLRYDDVAAAAGTPVEPL